MSHVPNKIWDSLVSGRGGPGRQAVEGLVFQLAQGSSRAQQGFAAHAAAPTAAVAAAVASTHTAAAAAAMASSTAAVTAAAAAGAAAAESAAAAAAAAVRTRGWRLRAALTAVLVTFLAWLALLKANFDILILLIKSTPKTFRTAVWAVRAGLSYKKFAALHQGQDPEEDTYQEALGELHTQWAKELLQLCRRNGGVYVKAGQFASSFGAVPREYRLVLAGLEDRAVPRPYPAIEAALQRELAAVGGMAVFSEFEQKATAAASLAQVHRAVLRDSGQAVAVKVQYPGLENAVASDLAVLRVFNGLAALLFPDYRLAWLVDELEMKLSLELDFRTELTNASRVADLLHGNRNAAVPRMHPELCTKRLVVMEWVDGCKVSDKEAIVAKGINPQAVGRQMVKLFGELTLLHGFMHGDPHAGNIMVRSKGRRSLWSWIIRGSRQPFEVVLLDHGTYLEIPEELREQLCQLWCSFVLKDKTLQRELARAVAGDRGAVILPVLLTQTARSRTEERAVQKAAGIQGVGDMAALLQTAPKPLIEVLRINTVIRSISNHLGVPMTERQRILAGYARKGLPPRGTRAQHVHHRFKSLCSRAYLNILLGTVQAGAAVQSFAVRSWSAVLGFWDDII